MSYKDTTQYEKKSDLKIFHITYRINIKNFDPRLLEINKLSFKSTNTNICHIEYITMRGFDHVNIDSENPLYCIFNNVGGYIEENNGDKYLIFASANNNKGVLEKYTKIWNETKNKIKTCNGGEPINCKKDFMKTTFESDDNLPLGKLLNIPSMMIVARSVCQEDIIHKLFTEKLFIS